MEVRSAASVWSRGPQVWSREPQVWSRGPQVWCREPQVWSRGPQVWSRGPQVWSRGPQVWSRGPQGFHQTVSTAVILWRLEVGVGTPRPVVFNIDANAALHCFSARRETPGRVFGLARCRHKSSSDLISGKRGRCCLGLLLTLGPPGSGCSPWTFWLLGLVTSAGPGICCSPCRVLWKWVFHLWAGDSAAIHDLKTNNHFLIPAGLRGHHSVWTSGGHFIKLLQTGSGHDVDAALRHWCLALGSWLLPGITSLVNTEHVFQQTAA